MQKKLVFKGCGVAIITPMHPDGSVNYEEFAKLIDFQIDHGTDSIVVCGTTGESATLSYEEHEDVVKYCIEHVAGRVPVIAGAGSNDTAAAIHLAKHAKAMGADSILVVTPYYNKTSQKGLIEHYYAVADATDLPIILYNVPSRTSCNILPATYAELAKHPNIVAVKEANGDVSAMMKTRALCGDSLALYSGNDDNTIPITAIGGMGVISVAANVCPTEMHQIAMLALEGNYTEALRMNLEYMDLMNALFSDVNPIPVKEALNMMGFSCGRCRLPLSTLSDANREVLAAVLKKHGCTR